MKKKLIITALILALVTPIYACNKSTEDKMLTKTKTTTEIPNTTTKTKEVKGSDKEKYQECTDLCTKTIKLASDAIQEAGENSSKGFTSVVKICADNIKEIDELSNKGVPVDVLDEFTQFKANIKSIAKLAPKVKGTYQLNHEDEDKISKVFLIAGDNCVNISKTCMDKGVMSNVSLD